MASRENGRRFKDKSVDNYLEKRGCKLMQKNKTIALQLLWGQKKVSVCLFVCLFLAIKK